MIRNIAIVGFGLAGASAARSLRGQGYDGRIHLFGEEPVLAYDRPSLSKSVLAGVAAEPPPLLDAGWYTAAGVDVHSGERVQQINPAQRRLLLPSGASLSYDRLLLATGARARTLSLPGATLDGVLTLRDQADSSNLRGRLGPGVSLSIVGGGLIGCEVATTARKAGAEVRILESADELLLRVLGRRVGAWCRERLEALGVVVQRNTRISAFEGKGGRVRAVAFADGERVTADVVLVSIGAEPDTALAQDAGLTCARGVPVDATGLSACPDLFVAGDAACWPLRDGGQRSLETYLNSQAQAATAAAAMLGRAEPSPQVPRAWTEIAGHRIQTIGDFDGPGDWLLRGDAEHGSPLLMLRVQSDAVAAALSVDATKDFATVTRLVEARTRVTLPELRDPAFNLRDFLRARPAAGAS
ncbi:FAD-dependent oxidoreductase [Nevskia sp.]|uniref:NAD(P)/FAD-dependent oxidoreductase n=1 Tax=Nevskia sp. TaxID=1929292 RepID=UPI0025EC4DDC|nr:FAD-dependent oxidoreductase [Nevskia sp.]